MDCCGRDSFADVWYEARALCGLLIISVAAVCINPNGARMYSYPFETLASHAMMQFIQEWRLPDFHQPLFQALALLLLATFSALALSDTTACRPVTNACCHCLGRITVGAKCCFLCMSCRPAISRNTRGIGSAIPPGTAGYSMGASWQEVRIDRWLKYCVVGARANDGCFRRQACRKNNRPSKQEFPAAAVNFMRNQKPPQPIYNEYIWGGDLIWKLYPDYRVYIDGRADVYGDDLLQEFLNVHDGKTSWREPLDSHGIRTVLVKPDVALASLLRQDNGCRRFLKISKL